MQLECVFPITLQKITKQHHNYSHAWLSQHGAARRAGRRERCCGLTLVTLGNVTGTLRPWALSPVTSTTCLHGSAPQCCGCWWVTGSHPSAEDVPAAGLLFLALLDLPEGPLCPRATQSVGLPSSLQHSPGCGWCTV